MLDVIKNRMALCDKNIDETFKEIRILQSKHQQLIGYKQALSDIVGDLDAENLSVPTESIRTSGNI